MLSLLLSAGVALSRPAAVAFSGADCRTAIAKNTSVNGLSGHGNMVSGASLIYVRVNSSMFAPFAFEYQTFSGREFMQFPSGAVYRFVRGSAPLNMAIYTLFDTMVRPSFAGARLPYPLNYLRPHMALKRYACSPKLWPSG